MKIFTEDISEVARVLSMSWHRYWNSLFSTWAPLMDTWWESMLKSILPWVIDVLIHNPNWAYKKIEIPKKNWGVRIIHAPLWEEVMQKSENTQTYSLLSLIQKRINTVLGFIPLPNSVCAFHPWVDPYAYLRRILDELSCRSNASIIWWVYKIDIKDFFNSITEDQVRKVWEKSLPILTRDSHVGKWVIDILTLLSCYNGKLNQWPPSSPVIANIVWFFDIDRPLRSIEQTRNIWSNTQPKNNWIRYLRYADDIIVISFDWPIPSDIPKSITYTIVKGWFKIAEEKTELLNNSPSYSLLWISLIRDKYPLGFQFQIGTARDRDLSSEILKYKGEWIESIKWKLWFNSRISLLWRSGIWAEGYPWLYSRRVAHALWKRWDIRDSIVTNK